MKDAPIESSHDEMSSMGARIRRRRWVELRVFQEVVAAAVGISPAQLCEIERGSAGTTEGTLWKLADVLGLDYAELRAQAEREGRLARHHNRLGQRPPEDHADAARPPLPRLPEPPPRPPLDAARGWLTTAEAARLLGCTPSNVADLIRAGRLRPAVMEPKGKGRQRRWLVSARAVAGYDPPNYGRRWRRQPPPPPPGYLTIPAFAQAVGLPTATLYRRLEQWGIRTVRDGRRRWIPEDQLAVFHEREESEGTR